MRSRALTLALVSAVWLAGCGDLVAPPEPVTGEEPLIYGDDNRIEAYEAPNSDVAWLFESEAAIFWDPDGFLTPSGDGFAIDTSLTFADYIYPLCSSEPYRDQPVPAICSAFLVADDLVVTAGHCVRRRKDCNNASFVFGFHMQDASTPVDWVPADNVYHCSSVVASVENWTNDYSVVRLDRPVVGRQPLPLRRSGAVEDDDTVAELAVVGHPVGMPAKYADQASIIDASHPDYVSANLDVYGGNSGSAVVSLDGSGALHLVEGILVRGNEDWSWTGTCYESAWCPDSGCNGLGEEFTRSTNFDQYVPVPGFCGDSLCDASEDCTSCEADCGPCPVCGDSVCDASEDCASCETDCGACPVCGGNKDSCTVDADCCSLNCRGGRCRGN